MASRVFTAAFPGVCAECGDEIEPGDEVQFAGDVLVHEDCNTEIEDELSWA
jgi:hypothetical protein